MLRSYELTLKGDQLYRLENHLGFFLRLFFFGCGISSLAHKIQSSWEVTD